MVNHEQRHGFELANPRSKGLSNIFHTPDLIVLYYRHSNKTKICHERQPDDFNPNPAGTKSD